MSQDTDSEDDFMSDKFLLQAEAATTTASGSSASSKRPTQQTYAERRKAAQRKHLESQPKGLKAREEARRKQGLETSLFQAVHEEPQQQRGVVDRKDEGKETIPVAASDKATRMMMKMGWKVGEGLGRKRSPDADQVSGANGGTSDDEGSGDLDPSHVGIASKFGMGMRKRRRSSEETSETKEASKVQKHQTLEPLRVSMWAGKFFPCSLCISNFLLAKPM